MNAARGIYAAAAVLLLGGGGLFLSRLGKSGQLAAPARPIAVPAELLPDIRLAKGDAQGLTKIELTSPDDDDKRQLRTVTLEKLGPDWEMTTPLRTRASLSKVAALIDNLADLHLWMVIDKNSFSYDQHGLTEAQALHIVAWKGAQKVRDLYCGKSSPQGQLARLAGRDEVFALVNWGAEGYSGFLYTRDVRSWRETSIFHFEPANAVRIEITNRNGAFSFSRSGAGWTGSFARRRGDGQLGKPDGAWKNFDGDRVEDLLRAYKALDADDFGGEDDRARSGVDQAESTGGVVRIKLEDRPAELTLRVGKLAMSTSRWAIQDSRWAIQDGGDGTLYALSPWTAGWATAGAGKFETAGPTAPPADRRR